MCGCVLGPRRTNGTLTHMDDYKRKKGKDKRKETWKKYGKNTSRGLRHKLEQCLPKESNNMSNNQSDSKTK